MTDFQDMMEIPYFREMVNTPSTHVYLWKNSVDVLHGGKHLTYGGVSANLIECPRCTDGYWWNHAQGMKECSTDGCHTFIESNQIGANLNIPPTTQDNTGDKRVSEIQDFDWDDSDVLDFDDDDSDVLDFDLEESE